jgi:hypothetical protein
MEHEITISTDSHLLDDNKLGLYLEAYYRSTKPKSEILLCESTYLENKKGSLK